jgi:hypothetical protein
MINKAEKTTEVLASYAPPCVHDCGRQSCPKGVCQTPLVSLFEGRDYTRTRNNGPDNFDHYVSFSFFLHNHPHLQASHSLSLQVTPEVKAYAFQ